MGLSERDSVPMVDSGRMTLLIDIRADSAGEACGIYRISTQRPELDDASSPWRGILKQSMERSGRSAKSGASFMVFASPLNKTHRRIGAPAFESREQK